MGAPTANRLCTKKPSNSPVCGWMALTYVTMRNADCDSPSPIIVRIL